MYMYMYTGRPRRTYMCVDHNEMNAGCGEDLTSRFEARARASLLPIKVKVESREKHGGRTDLA